MADRDSHSIRKRLVEQWNQFLAELSRLEAVVVVRPRDGYTLFQPKALADPGVVGFELRPVVFNLPERRGRARSDLFVVIRGRLAFRREEFRKRKELLTHDFGSSVSGSWRENPRNGVQVRRACADT